LDPGRPRADEAHNPVREVDATLGPARRVKDATGVNAGRKVSRLCRLKSVPPWLLAPVENWAS
jgi:hypothetical protein